MKKAYVGIILAVVIIAGGYFGYSYYNSASNSGNMAIAVADAPVSGNVSAVYITFSPVALHSNSSGWQNYSLTTQTVNILGLTATNASLLSNISLHAGTYTMIRLYITKVTVEILGANISFSLQAPFAFINHPFTVSAHSTTEIVIDFNLNQDLNLNAKIFTPSVGFTMQ